MLDKWEYKIIDETNDGCPDSVYELNDLGKEGWELVTNTRLCTGAYVWYFKRKVLERVYPK